MVRVTVRSAWGGHGEPFLEVCADGLRFRLRATAWNRRTRAAAVELLTAEGFAGPFRFRDLT